MVKQCGTTSSSFNHCW